MTTVPLDEPRPLRRTGDEFAEQAAALLPTGSAWPRDPDSDGMRFQAGQAGLWSDVDGRAADLLERESDPRFTLELLDDWERAFGLPDPCVADLPQTIEERRLALVSKITTEGGQSRAFFIALAAALGYVITITEFSPFVAGISHAGDPYWQVGSPGIRFYWKVTVPNPRLSWFIAGQAHSGIDPMCRIARAEDLECRFNQLKPAHTIVIFDYSGA